MMYNFELKDHEELIDVFDDIWVRQEDNEKRTSVALTNQRLLFLGYDKFDCKETLRIARNIDYLRCKEIYYQINLEEIINIEKLENYIVHVSDSVTFEFDNDELFHLILEQLK